MIVYGCVISTINRNDIKDISTKELNWLLKEHKILIKSLPGHGNKRLKKRNIDKPSINVIEWFYSWCMILFLHVYTVL